MAENFDNSQIWIGVFFLIFIVLVIFIISTAFSRSECMAGNVGPIQINPGNQPMPPMPISPMPISPMAGNVGSTTSDQFLSRCKPWVDLTNNSNCTEINPSYDHVGHEQNNCPVGFGRTVCQRKGYMTNCLPNNTNFVMACQSQFGNNYTVGETDQSICPDGYRRANCQTFVK